jgi:tRNA pseudouridine38-40 synthase
MPKFRLTLAYDGTDYAGSQIQPDRRTVQGELDRVLRDIAGGSVQTVFAGRTDRGVHAIGQVVAAGIPHWRRQESDLACALQALLPADLAATDVVPCAESFNPRFDATWREYRYWIAPAVVNPFLRRFAWTPRAEVEARAMSDAALLLLGTHDFATFASGGEGVPWSQRAQRARGTTRTVLACDCREREVSSGPAADGTSRVIEIRVVADGFLPRMVRNIAGALVEVGQGRRGPEWVGELLAARDRRYGSESAPPHGLVLFKVGFGAEMVPDRQIYGCVEPGRGIEGAE